MIKDLFIYENYITSVEEKELIDIINKQTWHKTLVFSLQACA